MLRGLIERRVVKSRPSHFFCPTNTDTRQDKAERLTNEKIPEPCTRRAVAVKHLSLRQGRCQGDTELDVPAMAASLVSAGALVFVNLLIFLLWGVRGFLLPFVLRHDGRITNWRITSST